MTLKEHTWKPYSRKAKSIELNIKDNQEQTIDFFKIYKGKTRDTRRVLNKLKEKYDFSFEEEEEKNKKQNKKVY